MTKRRERLWHLVAGLSIGFGAWYLFWRWTASINPEAVGFSIAIASAETLFFLGTLLFYYDIWREGDTPKKTPPNTRSDAGLLGDEGEIAVDVFITTYDEELEVVLPSIEAAKALEAPQNTTISVYLLDDGNRPAFQNLANKQGIGYITRETNEGFKAGNLRNALFETDGDFVLICDADTRVFPKLLQNTLGYFRDPQVAWVQTPHWFYDVPEGTGWDPLIGRMLGRRIPWLAKVMRAVTGTDQVGRDPFLVEPDLFFDVIQRRRNRNGASFCCGAGSLHRREAVFDAALKRKAQDMVRRSQKLHHELPLNAIALQPFRFHVSEDIYTSILLHSDTEAGWKSVYHPQVEARMLSPWSTEAWAVQKLKYAGGTLDIMLRDNPLFRWGMPWRIKLHYAATFWSYLSVLWAPLMLFAPVISLMTGLAPVAAYSTEFFARFLPMIIIGECAMLLACKGHNTLTGRVLSVATLFIQLRAFWSILRRRQPKFPTTPKTPVAQTGQRHLRPILITLAVFAAAAAWGIWHFTQGDEAYSLSFMIVNLFWLCWNSLILLHGVGGALLFRPELPAQHSGERKEYDVTVTAV